MSTQPTISQWYRNMKLPTWGLPMESFIAPSIGILSNLLPDKAAKLPVVFVDGIGGTALADQINNRIVVDRSMFSANPTQRLNPYANKEEAIAFALGAIVHEGSHFAWSPATLPEMLNKGIAINSLTTGIANIVEDLYIEHRVISEQPSLAWMVFSIWSYLFDERMPKAEQWDGVTVTNENLGAILNRMVDWKDQNKIFTFRSAVEETLYNMMYEVRGMQILQDRKDLFERIINFLKSQIKEQKQEQKQEQKKQEKQPKAEKSEEKESGKGAASEQAASEQAASQSEEDSEDESKESDNSEESEYEYNEDDFDDVDEEEGEEEYEATDLDEDESGDDEGSYLDIEEILKGKFAPDGTLFSAPMPESWEGNSRVTDNFFGCPIVEVEECNEGSLYVVIPPASKGVRLNYDKKWAKFGEIAKQRGATRFITGPANMSGKRLTHPQNIKDGNVFSTGRLQSTNGSIHKAPPQITLVLDCSNSMEWRDKFERTMLAAFGASVGMADAGITFSVYGFTTTEIVGGDEVIMMYEIKSMKDKAEVALDRLAYMYNHSYSIHKAMTPDADAIEFAAQRFANNGSDRVIIVISDGGPCTKRYRGFEFTEAKVAEVRAKGIKVFGLSIDSSADMYVQAIYGKDTLCDSDPNAINKFLNQFI